MQPLSPHTAQTTLNNHPDHLETVQTIARGLLVTIAQREARYKAQMVSDQQKIQDERDTILDLQSQLAEAEEKLLGSQHQPDGYILNTEDRAPHLEIPIQDGYFQPAHWVRKLPDGRVQALPQEHDANTIPLIAELYALPVAYNEEEADYVNPVMPLPGWILALFRGPTAKFAEMVATARSRCNWGVQCEIDRLRNLVLGEEDVEQQIKDLQEQLRSIRGAKECAHGRLEQADFVGKMHDLRLLPNMGRNNPEQHHHARPRGFSEVRGQQFAKRGRR